MTSGRGPHLIAAAIGIVFGVFGGGDLIAMSNSPDPEIEEITGRYAGPGVECPQFLMDTGETVSLVHAPGGMSPGETVTLLGKWAWVSKCMQGRAFYVSARKTD